MVKASVIETDKQSLLSTRVMLTLRHAIEWKLQALIWVRLPSRPRMGESSNGKTTVS